MITIYHNPRCSKSRQALAILEASGKKITIVNYLEDRLTENQLSELIKKLEITPIDLIRKGEKIWKEHFKGLKLSDTEIITSMAENPKLIERPIVTFGDKATIGRPIENIIRMLKEAFL